MSPFFLFFQSWPASAEHTPAVSRERFSAALATGPSASRSPQAHCPTPAKLNPCKRGSGLSPRATSHRHRSHHRATLARVPLRKIGVRSAPTRARMTSSLAGGETEELQDILSLYKSALLFNTAASLEQDLDRFGCLEERAIEK